MSQSNAEAARVFSLLETEWESASKRETGGTTEIFTKHLLDYRKQLGLSKADVAAKLSVQWTTVDRWEDEKNGSLPRKSALEKLRGLMNLSSEGPREHPPADPSDDSHLGYRTLEYVTALQRYAKRVWIGKAKHRFQAVASDSDLILGLIEENMKSGTQYTYVFSADTPASDSFDLLQAHFETTPALKDYIGNQFKSLKVDDKVDDKSKRKIAEAQFAAFGFNSWYQSWIVLEYTEDAAKRFKRERDIFVEIPVRKYHQKFPDVEAKESERWDKFYDRPTAVITLELAGHDAKDCWDMWKPFFDPNEQQ